MDEWQQRMEGKLDALTSAMTDLVALQRDIHHLFERVARVEHRQDKLDERVRVVATDESRSSAGSEAFERIILLIMSAGLGVIGTVVVSGVL